MSATIDNSISMARRRRRRRRRSVPPCHTLTNMGGSVSHWSGFEWENNYCWPGEQLLRDWFSHCRVSCQSDLLPVIRANRTDIRRIMSVWGDQRGRLVCGVLLMTTQCWLAWCDRPGRGRQRENWCLTGDARPGLAWPGDWEPAGDVTIFTTTTTTNHNIILSSGQSIQAPPHRTTNNRGGK